MKKFKKIDEMRKDSELLGLNYGQHEKVLIDNKEYIATLNSQIYDDIIEDYVYNAIKEINKKFGIEMPALKSSSFEDLISEACVDLRKKLFEEYANAGVNFINVREERDDGMIYENLEDDSTEISGVTTGTVLTIEGQEYIVIENVQGNQYKVLSSDAVWKRFDDNRSNNYATSTIADYLDNDYYNNLPEIIKNTVVKTPIQQTELNTYAFINPTNWGEKNDAGTHKVFIPSWEEVTKVYGTSHYKLKAYAPDSWTWLRDIYSSDVLVVDCNGILDSTVPHINLYVRPAFVLDLSKIEFTKNKEGGIK